jgi:hypothetical protein
MRLTLTVCSYYSAFRIFQRALFNFDIATGNISTTDNQYYATEGPKEVFNITNEPVTDPGSQCYVLDRDQCTEEQWETVMNGTALVRNWIVVDANTSSLFPDLVGNGSESGNDSTLLGHRLVHRPAAVRISRPALQML